MDEYFDFTKFCKTAAASHPSNQLYCLVDHAGMPGLDRQLVRCGASWASLFQGSSEQAALAAAPLLFPLIDRGKLADAYLLQWLATHGTYTSSMLMLSSPASLDTLRVRLARRMQARVSEQMDVLLRYFDPRVFEILLAVLEERQCNAFLNPADCWWYLDRVGELVRQPSRYVADEIDSGLELSAPQEFALLDASEIDQVAEQLQSMLPDPYISMGVVQRVGFLKRHIAAAHTAGIAATHEVALYCALALLHGEDFARTSPWQALLEKVAARSTGFADAVAALED